MKLNKSILLLVTATMLACVPTNNSKPEPEPSPSPTIQKKSSKRGVCFGFGLIDDITVLSPYISWSYNWGNTQNDETADAFDILGIEYCPMIWNGRYDADKIRSYVRKHPKTKYLLGFNEPNLTDQANMTPAEAAKLWPDVVNLAKELNLKLVSPAMNYGTLSGYGDPIKWLDEFFEHPNVDIEDIDAISIHCYMATCGAMKGYVQKFFKYGKPVWLTEFCAWEKWIKPESQQKYMREALEWLENEPMVERYAWFMPRTSAPIDEYPYNQLLTHDFPIKLTEIGEIYANYPICE